MDQKYAGKTIRFLTADSAGLFCALTGNARNGADGLAKLAAHPAEFEILADVSKPRRKPAKRAADENLTVESDFWGYQGG